MDNLQQNVDFIFNTAEANAKTEEIKKSIKGVGDSAERTVEQIEQSFNQLSGAQQNWVRQTVTAIGVLKAQMQSYGEIAEAATDPAVIEAYNIKIRETAAEIARLRGLGLDQLDNPTKKATSGFNGLQHSINQITRELPSMAYGFQVFASAIGNNIPMAADQISDLVTRNKELKASGEKTVPVWKQVISGLFNWNTYLTVGLTLLTVYGKEIGNFFASLFKGKTAIDQAKQSLINLNKAMDSGEFQKAIVGLEELKINLDLAKQGMADKTAVVEQYNESIGKTAKEAKTLDDVEQGLAKNADNYVKMTLYKAAANIALEEAAKKAVEAQRQFEEDERRLKSVVNGPKYSNDPAAGADQFLARGLANEAAARKKEADKAINAEKEIAAKFTKQAAESAKAMGGLYLHDNSKKEKKVSDDGFAVLVDSRKSVLDKLADLDDEYARKSFTKDEEEVQALKDKFARMRRVIEDENAKIAKFNADKNHVNKIALIDATGIAPIEQNALEDLGYRQQTEKLKVSLNEQKKVYAEFEDYKTTFGAAKAEERFKKDVDTSKSYLQVLTEEYNKLKDQEAKGSLTGVQKERLKLLGDGLKEEQRAQQDNFVKLLADLQSFEDRRELIQETAIRRMAELRAKGHTAEAEALRKKSEAELTEFDKSRVEQLNSYKALFENIDSLSTSALRKGIGALQKEVGKLKLTPEAKQFFDKLFGDLEFKAQSKGADDFKQIASSLEEAANLADQFDQNLGKAFSTASNIAGQVGNIKQGIAGFEKAKGSKDIFGQISAGISVFSAFSSIASGIGSLFNNSEKIQREREEQLKREVDLIESVNKRIREQIELNKELLGDKRVKGYAQSMADIAVKIDEQNKKLREQFSLTGTKFLDDRVQNNDASFVGTKQLNEWRAQLSLANMSEEAIKALYDNGKLDDRAKAAYDSLVELRKQQKDLLVEMNTELVGFDFDSFLNGFTDLFKNDAEPTVEQFAQFFEERMQEANRKAFQRNVLEESLKEWYLKVAEFSKDGMTAAEKDLLQADYNNRVDQIRQQAKALEEMTGTKLGGSGNSTSSPSGAAGVIRRELTEETGGALLGRINGLYDLEKQQLTVSKNSHQVFVEQLQHQEAIKINTYNTVEELKKVNQELKAIKEGINKGGTLGAKF